MKLTTQQLRNIIKEELDGAMAENEDESSKELRDFEGFGKDDEIANAIEDINDALYMLGEEEDTSGNLFHIINRLEEAKFTLQELVPGLTQYV